MRLLLTVLSSALLACAGSVTSTHDGGTSTGDDGGTRSTDAGNETDGGVIPADAGGSDAGHEDGGSDTDAGQEDAGMDAGTDAGPPGRPYVYVGSGSGSIFIYELDADAGTLTARGSLNAGTNPSFLAFHPTKPWLYAVREKTPGQVAAFTIDPTDGSLTLINQAGSGGNGPAHLSVDRTGEVVLVANYGSGTVAVLPIQADGGLAAATDVETPGIKAHQIVTDPSNAFVFVPTLGSDHIAQFALDVQNGSLAANAVPVVAAPAGAGPRHMDFHPSRRFAYVINELDDTLSLYTFDESTGRLTFVEAKSTLPAGVSGETNTTADVHVHPNGRFVYGSNRGHNSIAVFSIDETTGKVTLLGHQSTGGTTPRNFTLSADGSLMLVANQGTGTIHAFRVDAQTGALTALGQVAAVPSPTFVGFRVLP